MKETITPSETHELSALAPKNIAELIQGLDFLFLRYAHDQQGSHSTIVNHIKGKGGYCAFLQEIYSDKYDWDSTEEFTLVSLHRFLEKMSEIGDYIYRKHLTQEDRDFFCRNGGDSQIGFAGKRYFQDENIKTNDIVFLEAFLRYHLINQWIQLTEGYKNEVDESMMRPEFVTNLQSFMTHILVPSIALFEIEGASVLMQRLLFLISKSQELPMESIVGCNKKFESTLLGGTKNSSVEEQLAYIIHQTQSLILGECGSYGTIEFTEFRVQAVLLGEKNKNDPSKCLLKLLPLENFYFRKSEEIESDDRELFPIQGKMISNKRLIVGPRDCNIFDPHGNKVFWGDMSQTDVNQIRGTYYVLSQQEGWREVPDFLKGNMRSIKPANDPFSPGYMKNPFTGQPVIITNDVQWVEPDYVRMMAVAKIENGKYIENPRNIQL